MSSHTSRSAIGGTGQRTPALIVNATIIDGASEEPLRGGSIWIENGRIRAIEQRGFHRARADVDVVDASGKYIVPGLMNANVHLFGALSLERLVRHLENFDQVIVEAAQVALKNGLTTVFDTWGPRRPLMEVRDRINAGLLQGSRIFLAGNIVGFDGPCSHDFITNAADVATPALVNRINAIWVENVGRHLMWLPPERVAREVGAYIRKGVDFIKYASNEHYGTSAGAFLAFSPLAQAAIVGEAHRAGLTAQAHCSSVEGLRIAVEAGCDLIQHANITGPTPIPSATLDMMASRGTAAVVFPWSQKGFDWVMRNTSASSRTMWRASDVNVRNLIRSGTPLLLANDGFVCAPESSTDPKLAASCIAAPAEDALFPLATGHFNWFKAMEEKGCAPMDMLRAATRNIAVAYRKDKDLGTLEPGKIADMIILDKNPLEAAENYRSIHMIVKEGIVIDRDALPVTPILSKGMDPPSEEERAYIPFLDPGALE